MPDPVLTPEQFADLHFPFAGVDTSSAFSRQPNRQVAEGLYARSCAVGVNVRGYEPGTDRLRGGSRPGLVKWLPAAPVEGWIIQDLRVIVTVSESAVV